jgi:hypothetical protein
MRKRSCGSTRWKQIGRGISVSSVLPKIGTRYQDRRDSSRTLLVEMVYERQRLGREVLGTVEHPGHTEHGRDYACDLATFSKVWEERDDGSGLRAD